MMYELAIVGTFYDGYYAIWEDFLELFSKFWPDCPYPLFIVNDSKELDYEKKYNVTVYHAGENAEYSQRVQTALEKIDAKYYLLLLEDFFIGEKLDKNALKDTISFIKENNIKYYRMQMNEFTQSRCKGTIKKITPDMEYTISCQPSIWKREFLQECIGTEKYNAWVFEGIFIKAPKVHTTEFLAGCYVDYTNKLCLYHGAVQGKFLNETVDHFARVGYQFKCGIPTMDKRSESRQTRKKLFKSILPLWVQRFIKRRIKTDSIIEKYGSEKDIMIKKMGLDVEE